MLLLFQHECGKKTVEFHLLFPPVVLHTTHSPHQANTMKSIYLNIGRVSSRFGGRAHVVGLRLATCLACVRLARARWCRRRPLARRSWALSGRGRRLASVQSPSGMQRHPVLGRQRRSPAVSRRSVEVEQAGTIQQHKAVGSAPLVERARHRHAEHPGRICMQKRNHKQLN